MSDRQASIGHKMTSCACSSPVTLMGPDIDTSAGTEGGGGEGGQIIGELEINDSASM